MKTQHSHFGPVSFVWQNGIMMKEKISITLSSDVLASVDKLAGSKRSRSVVIEQAIRSYLRQQASAVAEVDDLQLINAAADQLNIEVADVLEYASVCGE
jgi:metal-responsive CopG/Arc/MetJ family transcriptional regulator